MWLDSMKIDSHVLFTYLSSHTMRLFFYSPFSSRGDNLICLLRKLAFKTRDRKRGQRFKVVDIFCP